MRKILCIIISLATIMSCGTERQRNTADSERAIYHWKTVFDPSEYELDFMREHHIGTLYLKMFDVAIEDNQVVPIATTQFRRSMPEDMNIVPTVFITVEAMRMMKDYEDRYAEYIVKRIQNMMSYNEIGKVSEVQLDCDWTASTRDSYFTLCREARTILKESGISLSSTIRLHQLREACPPVDRGVLMLYNTGAIKNRDTRNSILDYEDAKEYLRKDVEYGIPLSLAYPTYEWYVCFGKNRDFCYISHDKEESDNRIDVRHERSEMGDILKIKELAEQRIISPLHSNIIYHLDSIGLNNYSNHEIEQIYN